LNKVVDSGEIVKVWEEQKEEGNHLSSLIAGGRRRKKDLVQKKAEKAARIVGRERIEQGEGKDNRGMMLRGGHMEIQRGSVGD